MHVIKGKEDRLLELTSQKYLDKVDDKIVSEEVYHYSKDKEIDLFQIRAKIIIIA
jgi:hypothetical protein